MMSTKTNSCSIIELLENLQLSSSKLSFILHNVFETASSELPAFANCLEFLLVVIPCLPFAGSYIISYFEEYWRIVGYIKLRNTLLFRLEDFLYLKRSVSRNGSYFNLSFVKATM